MSLVDTYLDLVLVSVNGRVAHVARQITASTRTIRSQDQSGWVGYFTSCGRRLTSAKDVGETNIRLCKNCRMDLEQSFKFVQYAVEKTERDLARAIAARDRLRAMLAEPEIPE